MITSALVKELREKTGAGMMDCKKALQENAGDLDKASEYLRKKGIAKAAKRAGKDAGEGLVHSYIHAGGKIGVMIEVNCETDFVARTDDYKALVNDIALHVAAANPSFLNQEEVPGDAIEKEREILKAQAKESGKPEQVIDKIVEGRLNKYYEENCLMLQPFVKDPDKTIDTLVKEAIGKLGENISVRRFVRYQLGEQI